MEIFIKKTLAVGKSGLFSGMGLKGQSVLLAGQITDIGNAMCV